jgi:hypothetical protein
VNWPAMKRKASSESASAWVNAIPPRVIDTEIWNRFDAFDNCAFEHAQPELGCDRGEEHPIRWVVCRGDGIDDDAYLPKR